MPNPSVRCLPHPTDLQQRCTYVGNPRLKAYEHSSQRFQSSTDKEDMLMCPDQTPHVSCDKALLAQSCADLGTRQKKIYAPTRRPSGQSFVVQSKSQILKVSFSSQHMSLMYNRQTKMQRRGVKSQVSSCHHEACLCFLAASAIATRINFVPFNARQGLALSSLCPVHPAYN